MNIDVASQVSALVLDICNKLTGSVSTVEAKCSEEELHLYRNTAASLMGQMYFEILNPIYAAYPELKRAELDT